MHISIIGATFYGNRGAEGMLATTIGKLRNMYGEDLRFNVFSYYPDRDRSLVHDDYVDVYSSTPLYLVSVLLPCALILKCLLTFGLRSLINWLPSSVLALNRSKSLICIAGVSFIDGRTKFIPFNIATILPALVLGVPVIKFAQAMGPFNTWLNRAAARVFIAHCKQVFARGEQTYQHLMDLFRGNEMVQRADDVAFLHQKAYSLSRPASGLRVELTRLAEAKATGKLVIGVCPSVVLAKQFADKGAEYVQRMQDLVTGLVKRGWLVALYPNATRGDDMDKSHNNDLPLLNEILHGLEPVIQKEVHGFLGSYNAGQIHEVIAACDVQIVSRFHAMVASLASAVPVMVLGWSHKYHEVMSCFDQEDMVSDFKNWNISACLDQTEKLLREREERAEKISDSLPAIQQRALRQFEYVIGSVLCHR